jgi:hypothetical protein
MDNSSETDALHFQELNSKELFNMQNSLHAKNNLINAQNQHSELFNHQQNSENLINTMDNEVF